MNLLFWRRPRVDPEMVKAFEVFRDDGSVLTSEMLAFALKFWPSDLTFAGFRMFLIDNERDGRRVVVDQILRNARANCEWDWMVANEVGVL